MGKDEAAEALAYHDEMMAEYEKKKAEKMSGEVCGVCRTPLYTDPGAHELGIYLHALRYACLNGRWSYETGLPAWAVGEDTQLGDGRGEKGEGFGEQRQESTGVGVGA